MSQELPGGTVTFLFTDVEDSTRSWEEAPADMAAALQVHDGIVRDAIERHDGYVFTTVTDGFGAAFARAGDAASAAIEAQQRLTGAALPFAIRMGLHTGEATERDGSYVGPSVSRAARLTSLAHGGQVVASDTTEVMLRDRVAVRPLGEHRLRGLRGRTAVFQVIAEGLRVDFPVLRSVDRSTGNLPQQLNSFVGREDLVAEVADLVRSNRLVTLSGVGGVGKTRLAVEVGAELAGELPDGVWMVELAPVGEPSSVPAAIATALGITPQGDAALIDTVAEALAGRRLLLVVDNCEHVLSAAASAISAILARSDSVTRPRHVTRVPVGRGRDAPVGVAARARGWCRVRRGHAVRRSRSRGAGRLRASGCRDGRGRDRDLRDARRASSRHRAGRGADGGDERERGQRSTRRSLPDVEGFGRPAPIASRPFVTQSPGHTTC